MLKRDAWLGNQGAAAPLAIAAATTVVATTLSYALPESAAATGVGLWFLAVVYALVWHSAPAATIRTFGLSLAGLFEPEPLDSQRLLGAGARSVAWAAGACALVFPLFWLGYLLWYRPLPAFHAAALGPVAGEALGQLLGVAFPEEAFFRGYLQSALDRAWPPRRRVLGAWLGPGVLVSSAIFAFGHLLTEPVPGRLAVFFPALAFGYLRARTGGIGAPMVFHALCNLFAWYLGRSYGLFV